MNLINGSTLNETFTLTKKTGTVLNLDTAQKYVNKGIQLTLNAQSASPNFDGGALNSKTATATFTNATTSSTNTSGILVSTQATAGRDAVLYNGSVDGWVDVTDNTIASAAIASSSWNGTNYYLTGVTLNAGKTFNITVPNGNNETIIYRFTVDANGNTTVDTP